MKHVRYDEVERETVETPGAEGVGMRWLISAEDGAPHFYMRRFELAVSGHTPRHTHPWEHEVYILEGQGTVFAGGGQRAFRAGDVIFIPAGEEHSFSADRKESIAFLCLVPKEARA